MLLPTAPALDSVPDGIAPARALAVAESVARRVPEAGSAVGLEFRLGDDARVDLGMALHVEDRAESLARIRSQAPRSEEWERVGDLLESWASEDSVLHPVRRILLEFDTAVPDKAHLSPCVFVSTEDSSWARGAQSAETVDLVEACLGALLEMTGRRRSAVRLCIDALPGEAVLMHVGAMLSRPGQPVYLNLWLRRSHLAEYLAKVGIHVELSPAMELLLGPSGEHFVSVQISVSEEIAQALDIQLAFRKQPASEPRWATVLDAWVALRVSSREKARALLDLPGPAVCRPPGGEPILVARSIAHVKAGVRGARPIAKAYVSITPMERVHRRLTRSPAHGPD